MVNGRTHITKGLNAMTTDGDALRAKLDDFSRRLRVRTDEFRARGEFSDVHQLLLHRIQQRHDQLAAKLADAEKSPNSVDLIKAECARDFNALLDDFLSMEERFDAEAMKGVKT
jgi:hypothetical protein